MHSQKVHHKGKDDRVKTEEYRDVFLGRRHTYGMSRLKKGHDTVDHFYDDI